MLRLTPWFHSIAVRDEALIQTKTYNSEILPGDLPSLITLSWNWHSRLVIRVHHVLCRRSEFSKRLMPRSCGLCTSDSTRFRLRSSRRTDLTFDAILYRTCGEISYCDQLGRVETLAWRGAFETR